MDFVRGGSRFSLLLLLNQVWKLLAVLILLLHLDFQSGGDDGGGGGHSSGIWGVDGRNVQMSIAEWLKKYFNDNKAPELQIKALDEEMTRRLKEERGKLEGTGDISIKKREIIFLVTIYSLVLAKNPDSRFNNKHEIEDQVHPAFVLLTHCFSFPIFAGVKRKDEYDKKNQYYEDRFKLVLTKNPTPTPGKKNHIALPHDTDKFIHDFRHEFAFIFAKKRKFCFGSNDVITSDFYNDTFYNFWRQSYNMKTQEFFIPTDKVMIARLTLLLTVWPAYFDIESLDRKMASSTEYKNFFEYISHSVGKEGAKYYQEPQINKYIYFKKFFHPEKLPDFFCWRQMQFITMGRPITIQDANHKVERINKFYSSIQFKFKMTRPHISIEKWETRTIIFEKDKKYEERKYQLFFHEFLEPQHPGLIIPDSNNIKINSNVISADFDKALDDNNFPLTLFQSYHRRFYLHMFIENYRRDFQDAYDNHMKLIEDFTRYIDALKAKPDEMKRIGIAIFQLALLNQEFAHTCRAQIQGSSDFKGRAWNLIEYLQNLELIQGETRTLTDEIPDVDTVEKTTLKLNASDYVQEKIEIPNSLLPFLDQTLEDPDTTQEFAKTKGLSFKRSVLVEHFMTKFKEYSGDNACLKEHPFWYQRRTEFLLVFGPYIAGTDDGSGVPIPFEIVLEEPRTEIEVHGDGFIPVKSIDMQATDSKFLIGIGIVAAILASVGGGYLGPYLGIKWAINKLWPTTPWATTDNALLSSTKRPPFNPFTSPWFWIGAMAVIGFCYFFCCRKSKLGAARHKKEKKQDKKAKKKTKKRSKSSRSEASTASSAASSAASSVDSPSHSESSISYQEKDAKKKKKMSLAKKLSPRGRYGGTAPISGEDSVSTSATPGASRASTSPSGAASSARSRQKRKKSSQKISGWMKNTTSEDSSNLLNPYSKHKRTSKGASRGHSQNSSQAPSKKSSRAPSKKSSRAISEAGPASNGPSGMATSSAHQKKKTSSPNTSARMTYPSEDGSTLFNPYPKHKRTSKKAREADSKKASQAPSQNSSQAPSRKSSRAPSKKSSRAPSKARDSTQAQSTFPTVPNSVVPSTFSPQSQAACSYVSTQPPTAPKPSSPKSERKKTKKGDGKDKKKKSK